MNNSLYKKVFSELKTRIDQGKYPIDSFIPSESKLIEEFKVSRITIRRAIQELEIIGLVEKIHGKGVRVKHQKLYSNLMGVLGFSKETEYIGAKASSVILDFKTILSNTIISENLKIDKDAPIYFLKRLRIKNGQIVGINETYIKKIPGLLIKQSDLDEKTTLYGLYEKSGFNITGAYETIEAKKPSKATVTILNIHQNDPIFLRERITFIENDEPIEFSINTYRADEYKYVIKLKKN